MGYTYDYEYDWTRRRNSSNQNPKSKFLISSKTSPNLLNTQNFSQNNHNQQAAPKPTTLLQDKQNYYQNLQIQMNSQEKHLSELLNKNSKKLHQKHLNPNDPTNLRKSYSQAETAPQRQTLPGSNQNLSEMQQMQNYYMAQAQELQNLQQQQENLNSRNPQQNLLQNENVPPGVNSVRDSYLTSRNQQVNNLASSYLNQAENLKKLQRQENIENEKVINRLAYQAGYFDNLASPVEDHQPETTPGKYIPYSQRKKMAAESNQNNNNWA